MVTIRHIIMHVKIYMKILNDIYFPGVLSPLSKNRVIDALRICCLLLPPPNRRKLHLLLRLMVKMSENVELNVDDSTGTRKLVSMNISHR